MKKIKEKKEGNFSSSVFLVITYPKQDFHVVPVTSIVIKPISDIGVDFIKKKNFGLHGLILINLKKKYSRF